MFKSLYSKVEKAYKASKDFRPAQSSSPEAAIVDGEKLGFYPDTRYLVYRKSNIKSTNVNSSPFYGWKVICTIPNPKDELTGLVVCSPIIYDLRVHQFDDPSFHITEFFSEYHYYINAFLLL